MFDISWSHLVMFGMAAVVLIPTKDLPGVLRTVGRYVGDARRLARDFRTQVDDALRETELHDIRDSVAKEMRDIEKSASLSQEAQSLNSALVNAAATSGTQPEARSPFAPYVPVVASSPTLAPATPANAAASVAQADATAFGSGVSVPMTPIKLGDSEPALAGAGAPVNGAAAESPGTGRPNDGIDIVRAGRGSVAQRAAKAWKKTAGGGDGGA